MIENKLIQKYDFSQRGCLFITPRTAFFAILYLDV